MPEQIVNNEQLQQRQIPLALYLPHANHHAMPLWIVLQESNGGEWCREQCQGRLEAKIKSDQAQRNLSNPHHATTHVIVAELVDSQYLVRYDSALEPFNILDN